jgi:antitoxin (DNA-binding transcriptional repressor) of toxin-antitoxin stability system
MLATITVEETQISLKDLIDQVIAGQEIIITRNQQPVVKLKGEPVKKRQPRKAGNCIGMIKIVSDDDEHLKDFEEYITEPPRTSWPCQPGTAKDTQHWMAPDFDAPLEGFAKRPAPGLGKGMITIISDDEEHLKDFAGYMP